MSCPKSKASLGELCPGSGLSLETACLGAAPEAVVWGSGGAARLSAGPAAHPHQLSSGSG